MTGKYTFVLHVVRNYVTNVSNMQANNRTHHVKITTLLGYDAFMNKSISIRNMHVGIKWSLHF